jgi:hypothetical protein
MPSDLEQVDAGRLWASGAATGVVAAAVAVVTLFVARGPLDVTVLVPTSLSLDSYEEMSAVSAGLAAFVAALLATGALHLLMLFVPRPGLFFGWAVVAATAAAVAWPFTWNLALESEVAVAVIHGLVGLAIAILLSSVRQFVATPPVRSGAR